MKAKRNFQIEKKWKFLDKIGPVFSSDKIQPDITQILVNRGITNEKQALEFLNPEYEKLADPLLLPNIKVAIEKIKKAVKENKAIVIYGDYDVDGVSATAILVKFFKKIKAKVDYYIPSRRDEGYGFHREAIDYLKTKKTDLIITVDCGVSATKEIDYAKKIGIDVIVTDHHDLKKTNQDFDLPKAPVINPKKGNKKSQFYDLSGAGVAFYLVRALQPYFQEELPFGQEKWWLDLVALGTICDVVPLLNDNRILVKFGLVVLSRSKNVGIRALTKAAEINLAEIDGYKVGFVLGPRLNASGRLEHAELSLELLLTESYEEGLAIAQKLCDLNKKRQLITDKIVTEARDIIKKSNYDKNRKIFLLSSQNWPAGVVGIAASRLVEEYGRPVLIMEEIGNELKGSARSIGSFNIIKALSDCSEYFLNFGGHAQAAGFSLKKEHFVLLNKKLLSITKKGINESDLEAIVSIDKKILFKNIDQKLVKNLKLLEPYGLANHKPIFALLGIQIGHLSLVGNPAEHLKLTLTDGTSTMSGIAFQYGPDCQVEAGDKVDIAFTIELNKWKSQEKIDLHIIDIKKNK